MENTVLDLLLKGGRVIDPANGIDGPVDVGIAAGKVARLAREIPGTDAKQVVDVSGLVVTPGILDIHTHVYPFRPRGKNYVEAVHADAHLFSSGVTTTVDVGTAGWKDFPDFKENFIDRSRVRILALINIASGGMIDAETEQTEAEMQPQVAASLARAYPETILGIKTAHYWTVKPWDDRHHPWTSVERAVEAGELCGLPVMVDFWPRPPERSYPDLLLKMLRPGDIHTHVFAQQFPILSPQGRVNDFLFEARAKGILFDLGHGAGSFWFRNAVPAFKGGFPPDTISTDLHMGNINGPVVGMLNTMSKFLSMGMPLAEVIRRSTFEPARVIRRPELGTLSIGAEADVAVFREMQGTFGFADCGKAKMIGNKKLECQLTLRAGEIVYDPYGVSLPEWEKAPQSYWVLRQYG
ncbi:MAG: amidohydrolase/deacetylase family metallohydrolase [Desulfobacterales bacterium]|nr:amidohydrolase/deacetylase family metallohydrolase [Desulfobacterales bacterium]